MHTRVQRAVGEQKPPENNVNALRTEASENEG